MRHVERWCRLVEPIDGKPYVRIVLGTITLHDKAIRLYKSLGYEQKGNAVLNGSVKILRFEKDIREGLDSEAAREKGNKLH